MMTSLCGVIEGEALVHGGIQLTQRLTTTF